VRHWFCLRRCASRVLLEKFEEAQIPVDPQNGTLLPSAAMNLPANVLRVVRVVVID